MKHLYFVRHGQSEANTQHMWSGHSNHSLTSEGHEQAKRTAAEVKKQGLSFDIIVSSPLQRAHHTAQHIATAVDYPHDKIVLHDDFKERHFGELENTIDMDAFEKYKQDEALLDTYENAERFVDMQWRAQAALDYLHSLPHETVLVVAHGSFGRALRRAVDKSPLNERGKSIDNAELVKFI